MKREREKENYERLIDGFEKVDRNIVSEWANGFSKSPHEYLHGCIMITGAAFVD